ncbi:hypothetical protein [Microcystis phage Mvi-JY20]|uniref:Prevent-host-death family protein n=1 Tax=Microcystis phage Mvi-JY20 TaxID=3128146 RepID=A0AAX4QIC4_9CAUD
MNVEVLDSRAEVRDTANRAGIVIVTRSGNPIQARVLPASILAAYAVIQGIDNPVQTRVPWSTLQRDVDAIRDMLVENRVKPLPQDSLLQYPAD